MTAGPTRSVEKQAFREEILVYLDELYRTALGLTKRPADAEDLIQEAVLKAWNARGRFEAGSNGRAWMHRILMNTFINSYRKKRREREILQTCHQEGALRPVQRREGIDKFGDEVQASLDSLPEDFRDVVMLVDLSDLSYREVAECLGCPIGTVMSRLHRGRTLLKGRLRSYAVQEGYGKAA